MMYCLWPRLVGAGSGAGAVKLVGVGASSGAGAVKLVGVGAVSAAGVTRCISTGRIRRSACWPKPDYGPMEVQRSQLLNGMKVAAAKPLGAQIAACTIMYQAGSRYEVDDQLGASHFLRAASSCSGCAYTSFAKMRALQQRGCSLTCTSDRQTIAFTLRCPLPCFTELKGYLLDAAARYCYNQWEIDDRRQLIRDDLTRMDPETLVLDLVQRASWAGPLANSMYCEEERIDSMDENTLNCFASTHFKSAQCTVASVGLPFEETMKLAEKIEYQRERPPLRCEMVSYPRAGFECYDLGAGSDTWVAVAVPGCGTCEITCLMKHALVAAAAGTGDIQVGQHAHDRTPSTPLGAMAGGDVYTQYRAFNISYAETGLFGILAKTKAKTAWTAAVAASEFLTNIGDMSFSQIEVGQNRLKLALALHDEDPVRVAEGLALQVANGVQLDSARSSMCLIDNICPDEVCCTAKMLSSKCTAMALAVVGDVGAVPHDRELVCC